MKDHSSDIHGSRDLPLTPEEFGQLIGTCLRKMRNEQDSESFQTLFDIVIELVGSERVELAATVTHAIFAIITDRDLNGRIRSDDPLGNLSDDFGRSISHHWKRPEAGRAHYLAGRVAVELSAWELAQGFFLKALPFLEVPGTGFDIALINQALAGVHAALGNRTAATASSLRALDWYRADGDVRRTAEVLLNLGLGAVWDSPLQAAEYLGMAEREISSLRDGHLNASLLHLRAMVQVQLLDFESAEPLFRKALVSARRRQDRSQEQHFSQNLANAVDETRGPRRALYWRRKALSIAEYRQDIHAQATLQRSVALTLARLGKITKAISHLRACVELAQEAKDPRLSAEALADLGAIMLSQEAGVELTFNAEEGRPKHVPKTPGASFATPSGVDRERLDEALGYLDSALEIFLGLQDSDWVLRIATNRRNLIQLTDTEQAREELLSISRRASVFDVVLATDLIEEAARTECMAGIDPEVAFRLYSEVIQERHPERDSERAWALVEAGTELAELGEFHQEASIFVGEAVEIYTELGAEVDAATALNDAGIALSRAGQGALALEAFNRVVSIAEEQKNRVLLEMGLNNLAQLLSESGDTDVAISYLSQAAEIAADLGDHQAAAEHWCSVSNLLVSTDSGGDIRSALQRGNMQAELAGTEESHASVLSAEATRSFAASEYNRAARLWRQSSDKSRGKKRLERLSFALEAHSLSGDLDAYRKELDRFTNLALTDDMRQAASEMLWRPSLAWIKSGQAENAAYGLSAAAVLSLAELMDRKQQVDFSRLHEAHHVPRVLKSFYVTLANIATVLSFDGVSPALRTECRTLLTKMWHRDHGLEVADFLDHQLSEAEESLAST